MVLKGSYDSGLKTKIKNSWFDEQSYWRMLPVVNHAEHFVRAYLYMFNYFSSIFNLVFIC